MVPPTPFDPVLIESMRQLDYAKLLLLSPRHDTTGAFLALLRSAKKSILISIYGCTIKEVVDVLIEKHNAGVDVRILFDHTQACGLTERVQVQRIVDAKIRHWIGTSPVAHQLLHSKVAVIDGILTETGSWNYSVGSHNQANTFILSKDEQEAAKLTEFINSLIDWVALHEPQWQSDLTTNSLVSGGPPGHDMPDKV
jgi:phosphatidylserine/phosphatidylglycerophosphate/cardiolipin synthase-like enzyme